MMSPAWTFIFGLVLLILFGWYFATEVAARKRNLGLVLTILLVAFCVDSIVPPEKKIALGLDLRGGTSFLIRLVPDGDSKITPAQLEQAVEVIRKRVDFFGVAEPVIAPVGEDRIRVEMPGLDTAQVQQAQDQLQRVAKLEFALVYPNSDTVLRQVAAGQAILPPDYQVKSHTVKVNGKEETEELLVRRKADLGGDHVTRAYPFFDQQGYGVSMTFDGEGAKRFGDITAKHVGERLAILLDGEVQSAPSIRAAIYTGTAQITGNFTDKEARNLASVLENPLRTPVVIEETRSISAGLGADSIRSGVAAGILGLALVVVATLLYYRVAGFIAILGLVVNIVLLFGFMAMFHFTLTLPGIAGIILTIGMAVDANVLIYERLREEMAAGKSLRAALEGAYDKALSAILDANVTTLITSILLFWQGTGPVRGFAITLTLGIIASMFSALLVSKTAFKWATEVFGLKKISMLDLIPKRRFDFLGMRRWAMLASSVVILGSVAIFGYRGSGNFGIDFKGGDFVAIDSTTPITQEEARTALQQAGLEGAQIQNERSGTKELLSFRTPVDTAEKVVSTLQTAFPERGIVVASKDRVGAQIGGEFARKSLYALGLGLVGILIYVTIRFEFSFALGAVVALIHDVVITLGIFSLVGRELSLVMVGAILTIAGYSVNDTIVVYDRIREGLKNSSKRGSVQKLMNDSINETLGRTILTGGTTLLSVGALFFLGGAVLSDFAFAILIGILVGTYSSVFVAAPIVLWWTKLRGKSLRREVLGDTPVTPATP